MNFKSTFTVLSQLAMGTLLAVAPALAEHPPDTNSTSDRLPAVEIIEATVATYHNCDSYRDTGLVRTTSFRDDIERVSDRPFTTAFTRAGHFRFEFEESGVFGITVKRYIIWTDGDKVLTWWDVRPGIEEQENLSSAIAGATGVSGRSAHTIPVLLLPDRISGRRLTDMTDLERVEDASIGGTECYSIHGQYGGYTMTVWIEKATHLIRRIDFKLVREDLHFETTTTYDATVNAPVPTSALAFNPPSED